MKQLVTFVILVLAVTSCGKDRFESKPRLTLKSQSTSVVPEQGNLRLVFEFEDKEGDVNDTLFFKKERMNIRKEATVRDSLRLVVPDFPKTQKGEIILDLGYGDYLISAIQAPRENPGELPEKYESDSLVLKFVLKDKAGNKSDTVRIDNVVVKRTR
jgi:hypothetical protein